MADGRHTHIAEHWKRYNSPTNGPIWMKFGWSNPIMSPICPPCCGCHGNGHGALYIQQLWASGGRTCEPILMKFGTQQQIRTAMTVTWSNIKILKIQNNGRLPCLKILEMYNGQSPINGPTETQLGWSHPIISPTIWLPWQQPLPSNGALNILQLLASGLEAERVNQFW